MRKTLFLAVATATLSFVFNAVSAQSVAVTKTNPLKVYVHYMPWFTAPRNPGAGTTTFGNGATGTIDKWGGHWSNVDGNSKHPDNLITVINNLGSTVQTRDICAHYHPLIGPYDGTDTMVLEYHTLLMKLSGIDGVMIDWYGKTGSNGDVAPLFNTSNALIAKMPSVGLKFGLVMEDNFWGTNINQYAQTDGNYAVNNLFNNPNYIKLGDMRAPADTVNQHAPLVCVFGPIHYKTSGQWNTILGGNTQAFLPLYNQSSQIGLDAGGEFVWPYPQAGQNGNPPAWYSNTQNYYAGSGTNIHNRTSRNVVLGTAYHGFNDFYGSNGTPTLGIIPRTYGGNTLSTILALNNTYKSSIDGIQIATWNDYSEGTIIEPTVEFGFASLDTIQKFTGVTYTDADLQQVYRLFTLRKKYYTDITRQGQLNQVFNYFTTLQIPKAVALMDAIDAPKPIVSIDTIGQPSENGATAKYIFSATGLTAPITVHYTVGGTATTAHYTPNPTFVDSVILTPSAMADTIIITAIDDAIVNPNETIIVSILSDTTYNLIKNRGILTIIDNETPYCTGSMVINTATKPIIDGAADAIWSKAPANLLAQTISGNIQTGSTWQAMYDATNLYVLIHVVDNNLSNIGTNIYDQDGIELFIAGNNNKSGSYDNTADHQYRFNWNIFPYNTDNITGTTNNKLGIVYSIPTTTNGYTLEAAIPWATIGGAAPFNGKQIGFDININDQQNNSGTREATVGWNGTYNDNYQNTASFGTATLTICNGDTVLTAPVISSALNVNAVATSPFSYAILASETPTNYGATNLPVGLIINNSTGIISGTPTTYGIFTTTISAKNKVGNDTKVLTITIDSLPAITSTTSTVGKVNSAFSYQIAATHLPTSYNATGLPVGLMVNTTTGNITGIPITSGKFTFIISATNGVGSSKQNVLIAIDTATAVNFLSINVDKQSAAINVQWMVNNEVLVTQYQVQRSTDSINFTTINTTTTIANTGIGSPTYKYMDILPLPGKSYYRIKAISSDSADVTYYSNVQSVIYSTVALYPNPVKAGGTVYLFLNNTIATTYNIRLLNYLGQPMPLVNNQPFTLAAGSNIEAIQISAGVISGYYLLELKSASNKPVLYNLLVQ